MKNNKFKKIDVLSISFAHFSHDLYTAFLAPVLPILIETLGIPLFLAGFLNFFNKLPSLFNPLLGLLADKVSLKYFVIFTPLVTATLMSSLGLVDNYWILVIILILTGFSTSLFHVPTPVMIKKVSGSKIGLGMSFYMLGGELARSLGPLLITGAISIWTFEGSYRVIIIGIISSAFLFFKFKNSKIEIHSNSKSEKSKLILKRYLPFFLKMSGFQIFRTFAKMALTFYLPVYLRSKGFSLMISGASLTLLFASGTIGTFLAGPISDKIGRKNTLKIISILIPIFMIGFTFTKGLITVLFLVLLGLTVLAVNPVILAIIQEFKTEKPAFLNGIHMTIGFFISSIIAILIGLIADKIGLESTFKLCALLSFGGIPFILILKEGLKK